MVTFEQAIFEHISKALTDQSSESLCLVVVESTWGSSPRQRGSLLWADQDGSFGGSVSAGCLETAVVSDAGRHICSGEKYLLKQYRVQDDVAWSHGLSCGGEIDLLFIQLDASDRSWIDAALAAMTQQCPFQLIISAAQRPTVLPLSPSDSDVSQSSLVSSESADQFVFTHSPPPTIICIGAVPISQSLAVYARELEFSFTVIEPRESWLNAYPMVDGVVVESVWPEDSAALRTISATTAVVALTHDPKIDDQALALALNSESFYIGALGSQRTQSQRIQRLVEQGFEEPLMRWKLHGPIGLNIAADNPAQIALAAIAEIVVIWNKQYLS